MGPASEVILGSSEVCLFVCLFVKPTSPSACQVRLSIGLVGSPKFLAMSSNKVIGSKMGQLLM